MIQNKKNKGTKILLIACASLPLFAGCVSSGRNFPSDTGWIEKGKTSQKDVRMLLGEPGSVGNSGGTPTWTYGYYQYQLFGTARYKELKIFWDPAEFVRHFSYDSSFPDDIRSTLPEQPVYSKNIENKPAHRHVKDKTSGRDESSAWGTY
ncbi:MAG: hypothetical protein H6618_07070 [Deltaproteobacteria bacterium]|nr:hypothetical protein [Deltaproteobacteria bacterium]